jgi:proto-oncogene serine/threonine-protein kinase Pim-1
LPKKFLPKKALPKHYLPKKIRCRNFICRKAFAEIKINPNYQNNSIFIFEKKLKNSSGDKSSLEDRINSSSTQGSYADTTYSSMASSAQHHQQQANAPSHKPTYKLIKCIGFGGYGRVYEALRSDDGLPVIIKLIPKSGIVNWSSKQFSALYNSAAGGAAASRNTNSSMGGAATPNSTSSGSSSGGGGGGGGGSGGIGNGTIGQPPASSMYLPFEIECLLRLRDTPGIVKIYDFFEEATCFVIVMEKLIRCVTLFDLCNGKPFSFTHNVLRKIFTQLIRINLSIFAKGIVHRDIKPENILVNLEDYSIKIIDFGSAANFRGRSEPFREFQGTLECMPPEWILNGMYESEQATAWSIGVTFYFSVFGRYPFRNKQNIISGKFPLPYSNVSNELLQFLDSCFQMNAMKRFTLHQLLTTAWLKRYDKH